MFGLSLIFKYQHGSVIPYFYYRRIFCICGREGEYSSKLIRAYWNTKPGVTTGGTWPEWVPLVNGLIWTIRELILKVEAADSCETLGTNYQMHCITSWKNTILFRKLLVAWVWSIMNHIFWTITSIVFLRNYYVKFSCVLWLKVCQYDLQCTWGSRVCWWDNCAITSFKGLKQRYNVPCSVTCSKSEFADHKCVIGMYIKWMRILFTVK